MEYIDPETIKRLNIFYRRCIVENVIIIICILMLIIICIGAFISSILLLFKHQISFTLYTIIFAGGYMSWMFIKLMVPDYKQNLEIKRIRNQYIKNYKQLQADESTKFRQNLNELLDEH